jgi:hypothetical protein
MLGELRSRTPNTAPFVDFVSVQEFQDTSHITQARYARLIFGVVDSHAKSQIRTHRFAWTRAEEMLMGLSVFPELQEAGILILLGLTHKRGLRFVQTLNNSIVVAVTIACRTFCDEYKDRTMAKFMRDMAKGETPMLPAIYVTKVKEHMLRAMILALGTANDNSSILHELHRKCFALMLHPSTFDIVYIPRHCVREYVLALACVTHARLGCSASGAPLAGQRLDADTLRMIVGFIDFH